MRKGSHFTSEQLERLRASHRTSEYRAVLAHHMKRRLEKGRINRLWGKCELCGAEGALYRDHCHETGRQRGLICLGCNLDLGGVDKMFRKVGPLRLLEYVRWALPSGVVAAELIIEGTGS